MRISDAFVALAAICLILAAFLYRRQPEAANNTLLMAAVLVLLGIYNKMP